MVKTSSHVNLNHQSTDSQFKISFSADYVIEKNKLPGIDFTFLANTLAPNAPEIFDSQGNLNWENNTWENPFANLESEYLTKINSLRANTILSYFPIPSLEFKTNLGYTNYRIESFRTQPNTIFNPAFGLGSEFSSISKNNGLRQSWIIEPQISWKTSWEDASLNILLGSTFQQQNSEQFAQVHEGFPNNTLLFSLSAADRSFVLDDRSSEYNYQSFFGRINFNWKDRYILNLTGRRDGSSRFGPGKQFGDFGAVGAAWLFSEEAFLKNNSILTFGKLRGSYGITGSDNIGDYRFLDTYSIVATDYNGSSGLQPSHLFNPNFRWEENKKFEIGMELGFFDNRIFLSTAWYSNRSSNQLVGVPLPDTTGFNILSSNFDATVENTGWEIDFRSLNVQGEKFDWTTTFNISIPKNKLLRYRDLETSTNANRLVVGEPLSVIKLYHHTGLDPDTGIYQFEDYNDDGIINADDRQWLENFDPTFFGGLGNTINYKNFRLDIFFQFKKQKGYNALRGAAPGSANNQPALVLNRWQDVGDEGPTQRYTFGFNPSVNTALAQYTNSSAVVTNASFIRLRNVSLTYSLPKSLIKDLNASIYLQGQNLFVITKYEGADPEQFNNRILPPLRQVTLGLNLSF